MATADLKAVYTPQDLLTMPDGDKYELVDGQLVEKSMSFWSSFVAGKAYLRLALYAEQKQAGWVVPEGTTYQCFPDAPNKVRKPDTSFIRRERFSEAQATQDGHVTIPPDLAVEVVSPTDGYIDVEYKAIELLNAGVKIVWVINPYRRTARIYRLDGPEETIREDELLTADDVLPGFSCRLGDLFQPPTSNV